MDYQMVIRIKLMQHNVILHKEYGETSRNSKLFFAISRSRVTSQEQDILHRKNHLEIVF